MLHVGREFHQINMMRKIGLDKSNIENKQIIRDRNLSSTYKLG